MSNKKEREKRREQRLAEESQVSTSDRRTRLLQMAAGAVFLVIVAIVVVIVVSSSGSDGSGDSELEEVATVDKLLTGIPQEGLVLGNSSAPVELIEFGDLQCPVCKEYSEEILPDVIDSKVKSGEAKIDFRNFTIISEESIPAGAAAIAAGNQGRGWSFIELFYRNQGEERSGYVTDEFLTSIAKGAGVKDIARWNKERKDPKTTKEVEATFAEAQKYGFSGTPSFAIQGPATNGVELPGTLESSSEFEDAIEAAS
jgi:protein-disulfide isomerase